MAMPLRTADTYAIGSRLRPGELKLGRSNIPRRRRSGIHAGDPSLFILATFPFLDAVKAEGKAQAHFAHRHVEGEWYRVSLEELTKFYKKLQDEELPDIRAVMHAAKYMLNHENSALKRAAPVVSDELSLLLQRPVASTGLTVAEAVRTSLSATNPLKTVAALLKMGIMVQKADGLAVLDRSRDGHLERFFRDTVFARTWRNSFAKIAGFTEEGKCIKMSVWKKKTLASQAVLDRACAQ